jgi:hypothetical protein
VLLAIARPEKVQPEKQPYVVRNLQRSNHTQRVAQYAALFELRRLKSDGVDDTQYLHALAYVDLSSEQFVDIAYADIDRLQRITAALKTVIDQHSVLDAKMSSALTAEQYTEYLSSFDWDMSHLEHDDHGDMPWQLRGYLEKLRDGDKYTRIANMFKRSNKRDAQGRTAFGRYEDKAFGFYEEAVMDLCNTIDTNPLRNPFPDHKVAGDILSWLDRDVNPAPGFEPDVSAAGVPRVRGRKSKYSLIDSAPVVGVRLRKHWRQREALSKAALELIYAEPEEAVLTEEQQLRVREKLLALPRIVNSDDD